MTIEEIEARKAQIAEESKNPEADAAALVEELRGLNDEKTRLLKEAQEREELRRAVADGAGTVNEKREEEKPMTDVEIRSSAAYIDAFADYIRNGDPRECRALLKTENASGAVPVPVLVDEIVRTAWDKENILARVRKTYFRGNLKVAFERSATGAYEHTEGTTAPTEEDLPIGVKTLIPINLKKWLHLTDEIIAMGVGGEPMVRYIYEEIAYQILYKLSGLVIADIAGSSTTSSASAPGQAKITEAPGLTTIANAFANLSDEAVNPVVIMNKLTYKNFKDAQAAGSFNVDPFMDLPVLFNNTLPAYDSASANAVYAIVGDLNGVQVNYPEGDGIVIKWDDLSEAEKDLVKIVGRQYVAHGVTEPFRFTNIAKPAGT